MGLAMSNIVKRVQVTNTSSHTKELILEPWASEYPIAPGETLIVEAEGPAAYAILEIDEDEQYLTVYAGTDLTPESCGRTAQFWMIGLASGYRSGRSYEMRIKQEMRPANTRLERSTAPGDPMDATIC
jgi:hypothetical protein